jgi:hypothetical protein
MAASSIFAVKANTGAQQVRGSGALGALSLVHDTHVVATTGASTGTLANGLQSGQTKTIMMTVDGGDFVLTPAAFSNGTILTFSAILQSAVIVWTGTSWMLVGTTTATAA